MIAIAAAETQSRLILDQPVEISVAWEDDGTLNGKWTIEPKEVTIKEPVALLAYTLSRESAEKGVRFATGKGNEAPPTLWISPSNPGNFRVTVVEKDGKKDSQVIVADANDKEADRRAFSFRLVAVYDGVTRISHDPTIINVDPTQPAPPAAS